MANGCISYLTFHWLLAIWISILFIFIFISFLNLCDFTVLQQIAYFGFLQKQINCYAFNRFRANLINWTDCLMCVSLSLSFALNISIVWQRNSSAQLTIVLFYAEFLRWCSADVCSLVGNSAPKRRQCRASKQGWKNRNH